MKRLSVALLVVFAGCTSNIASNGGPPTTTPVQGGTVVSSLSDSGPGSLRSAIGHVNSARGSSAKITFAVGGTIKLSKDLPHIKVPVTIDGTTAPGYAGKGPVVEIDAARHGGLVFAAGSNGSQLLAIAVGDAAGDGITLYASSITLNLDYIGVNLAGKAFGNGGDGVFAGSTSANNFIGLNASQASGVVANVIAANGANGLALHGSSGNTVVANRIGTDPTGAPVGNGTNGIWITAGADDNEIGGTVFTDSATGQTNDPTGNKGTVTPVFVVPPLGNLISGNRGNGVTIDAGSQNNVLNGNFVGTSPDGDSAAGNGGDGVLISGSDNNSLIGCKFVNNPFVYYNVLSSNGKNGLHVTNSDDVTVQANFFGVGANNTTLLSNAGDGILIDGSSKNTQVGGVIPLGNVSAGNGANGIEVTGTASGFVTFNTFGGLLAFKGAAPNGNDGVLITATGGNQTVQTNVLSGNKGNGLEIGGDASGVVVDPNIVGLDTVGNAILPNGGDGLRIGGTAHGNVIGGYTQSVIPQNIFSANLGYGVDITGDAHDNAIFSSFIGTNTFGTKAFANGKGGIYVGGRATKELIGGLPANSSKPKRNIVSGNTGNGITLAGLSSYIAVIGNFVGVDKTGVRRLPNTGIPIDVKAGSTNNTIKGNLIK